jgi:hypothetical protein
MEYLSSFHYTWEYRQGRHNVADPISRNPNLACANLYMCAIGRARQSASIMDRISAGYKNDEFFRVTKNT